MNQASATAVVILAFVLVINFLSGAVAKRNCERIRKMSGNEKITVESMNLYYGKFHALKNINMAIPEKEITAFYRAEWLW